MISNSPYRLYQYRGRDKEHDCNIRLHDISDLNAYINNLNGRASFIFANNYKHDDSNSEEILEGKIMQARGEFNIEIADLGTEPA